MKYLRNYSKRLRKYEGALWFITHSVVDLLDPAVKRYGQAIIDNACYKFVRVVMERIWKRQQRYLICLSRK